MFSLCKAIPFQLSVITVKLVSGLSGQDSYKPDCKATEDDNRLEITDRETREIIMLSR